MHLQLLTAASGPIVFLRKASDATERAHCICICGCRWLCLGQLYFWEELSMQQGGPIVYAYAAANGYVWANCFFRKGS